MHLADEFYLIAHQDSTGKPRLPAKAAGRGTAAALLAELHLDGHLTIDEHDVVVTSPSPSRDPLAHNVLEHLLGEPGGRTVRDWLAFLAPTAVADVAKRLTRQGILERAEAKRPWGIKTWYLPVPGAVNDAAWPYARITARLIGGHPEELSLPDQILTGLCAATGLIRRLLWEPEQRAANEFAARIVGDLPTPMRILVADTELAIRRA